MAEGQDQSDAPQSFADGPQPLVMRSYRRHRRQAKWGTWSLYVPALSLLWIVFWYLMMKRPALPGAAADTSAQWTVLLAGVLVMELTAVVMAIIGLTDTYHKHAHAAIGMAVNGVLFAGALVALLMRLFSSTVG